MCNDGRHFECIRDHVRKSDATNEPYRGRSSVDQGVRMECNDQGNWIGLFLAECGNGTFELLALQLAGCVGARSVGPRHGF